MWSCDREKRKSVIATGLDDVKARGAEKLGYGQVSLEDLRLVLESDGTEVEEDEYFQTALKDTVFMLLREDERWLPPGVEALKAGQYLSMHALLKLCQESWPKAYFFV